MSGRRQAKVQSSRGGPPPPPSGSLTSTRAMAAELEHLRQGEVAYKAKVRSLEMEVSLLKGRLEGLRKAKNTTIMRKEEIRVSSPRLPSMQPAPPQCSHGNLLGEVDRLNALLLSEKVKHEETLEAAAASHRNKVTAIRASHSSKLLQLTTELEELRKDQTEDRKNGEDFASLQSELKHKQTENAELSCQLQEVLLSNEALRRGSTLLQEKSEALLEELSVKEAQWSQREDRLNAEIRRQWGERYHEWMTKAEKKMEELQQINTLLQSMLKTKQKNDL